jgi:hypothetical protein
MPLQILAPGHRPGRRAARDGPGRPAGHAVDQMPESLTRCVENDRL